MARMRRVVRGVVAVLSVASSLILGEASTAASAQAASPARSGLPAVFRSGVWYFRSSLTTGAADFSLAYGNRTDVPLTGDWDGDGSRTIGVYRARTWYLRDSNSRGNADVVFRYGNRGDVPVVGDWDGNGTFTPGVVRGNVWYLRNSNTPGVADIVFRYGDRSDIPMAGDWNGDGRYTPGIYRPSKNPDFIDCTAGGGPCYVADVSWYLRNDNSTGTAVTSFASGYPLAPADWDGDGTTTAGFMDDHARWAVYTHTNSKLDQWFRFGERGDVPLIWS